MSHGPSPDTRYPLGEEAGIENIRAICASDIDRLDEPSPARRGTRRALCPK